MKIRVLPSFLESLGSEANGPFVRDTSTWVLRLAGNSAAAAERLRFARSFRLNPDPEAANRPAGLEEGFAIAKLRRENPAGRTAFVEELEELPEVVAALPVLRTPDGEARLVMPDEFVLGFHEHVSPSRQTEVITGLGARAEAEIAPNRVRARVEVLRPLPELIDEAQRRDDVLFADVSWLGSISRGVPQAVFAVSAALGSGEDVAFVPPLTARHDHALIVADELESPEEQEQLIQALEAISVAGEIDVVSRSTKYTTIRVTEEGESAVEEILDRLAQISGVAAVFPALQDSATGAIRFADLSLVTVALGAGAGEQAYRDFGARHGLVLQQVEAGFTFGVFEISGERSVVEVLNELRTTGGFRFAEPAFVGDDEEGAGDANAAATVPEDGPWNVRAVRAPEAWQVARGDGVVIAVVDGLADLPHPLLEGALLSDTSIPFDTGLQVKDHGLHVMGICAGGESGGHRVGLAPGVKILPIAIKTALGRYEGRASALAFLARIAAARRWVDPTRGIDVHIDRLVVNCSWQTTGDILIIRDAISSLVAAGAVVCCSAGNADIDEQGLHFPSDYPGVLCIAATDREGRKLSVSNYGARIDFCAPGGDGRPVDGGDILSLTGGGALGYLYGTSMAAPHTAAVAALAWSRAPSRTAAEIVEILRRTARPIDHLQPSELQGKLGSGLIDARAAVDAASG